MATNLRPTKAAKGVGATPVARRDGAGTRRRSGARAGHGFIRRMTARSWRATAWVSGGSKFPSTMSVIAPSRV